MDLLLIFVNVVNLQWAIGNCELSYFQFDMPVKALESVKMVDIIEKYKCPFKNNNKKS